MRARLLWALLVLAAVFSMHGLNWAAAEQAPGGTSTHGSMIAMGHDQLMAEGGMTAGAIVAVPASSQHQIVAAAAGHADSVSTSHDAGGHSALMHALMVCLAVLAGGIGAVLAALAVWLARRRLAAGSPRVRSALRVAVDQCRPDLLAPDLSRLCVLRI